MKLGQSLQRRLIGLSIGTLLALLIWPDTGWLVRSQLTLCVPVTSSVARYWTAASHVTRPAEAYAIERHRETAARKPDDYELQLSSAILPTPGDQQALGHMVQRLRTQAARFPNRPGLYAAILRLASQSQVWLSLDRESWEQGVLANPAKLSIDPLRNTPKNLAAFDRDAEEGERLDPGNAYFPFMRSAGLFAAGRKAEALAALRRAGSASTWNEYLGDQVQGDWKLYSQTFGKVGALPRLGWTASILMPHLALLRNTAAVATSEAIAAETAGRVDEGIAIRKTVRHCGGLMRVQSTNLLGSLIGISIDRYSMMRPGGSPPISQSTGSRGDRFRVLNQNFDSYLAQVGRPQDIAEVDAEILRATRVLDIVEIGRNSPTQSEPLDLAYMWIVNILLLLTATWMLALGTGAALLARHARIQGRQGMPSTLRSGVAFGLIVGPLLGGTLILREGSFSIYLCLVGVLACGVLAVSLPQDKGSAWVRLLGAFGITAAGGALICSTFGWQFGGSLRPIVALASALNGEGGASAPPIFNALSAAICAAVPLLTLAFLGILSLGCRVPLSVGVVRGLRACAVPIGCLLLLVYCITVPMTVRREAALEDRLGKTVRHEGRYLAEMVGKQWPGPASSLR